jgi:hypothetical protein
MFIPFFFKYIKWIFCWCFQESKIDLKYFVQQQGLRGFGENIKFFKEVDIS